MSLLLLCRLLNCLVPLRQICVQNAQTKTTNSRTDLSEDPVKGINKNTQMHRKSQNQECIKVK
uniref:Secreted protein n=1 Tax=Echinococcus granulosus TaxID=6210 RepID=A0A068WPX3_ECHGR|nr:hypothetical protein EgrG_000339700 [Echinococcus granulosus]